MVPLPESSYFASLDKYSSGEIQLISWKAIFYTTQGPNDSKHQTAIDRFLADDKVIELLGNPFIAFPEPSQPARSAFETKTSAINVTPSSNGRFDIKEVKEDALWLSKEAHIDEISALRVTIIECQDRPFAQLRGPFSTEELAGLQDATGNGPSSLPLALLSQDQDAEVLQKAFDTQDSRRLRLLYTYLSEQHFFIKFWTSFYQNGLYHLALTSQPNAKGENSYFSRHANLAEELSKKLEHPQQSLLECIQAIGEHVQKVQDGSGWYKEDGSREELEVEWTNTHIAIMTQIMEVMFEIIDISTTVASSTVIIAWFDLLRRWEFFHMNTDNPGTQKLASYMQSVTAVLSTAILDFSTCIQYLEDSVGDVALYTDDMAPYIANPATIQTLHETVVDIANTLVVPAGPMVLAWSLILLTIARRVTKFKARQQARAEEAQFDHLLSADKQHVVETESYELVIEEIMTKSPSNLIESLASSAIDGARAFETLSDLATLFGNTPTARYNEELSSRVRILILELLGKTGVVGGVGYIPEVISTALTTLTAGQSYWDAADSPRFYQFLDPTSAFLEDDELETYLLGNARSRYPFESMPFLKLASALGSCSAFFSGESNTSILETLENIPAFTYALPDGFLDYETTQEEDNNNSIRLIEDVELFVPRLRMLRGVQTQALQAQHVDSDFCILAGTNGRMISESNPKVAHWFHEYSGLKYFGKLLETFLASSDQLDATTGDVADRDSVTEIITLFAAILLSLSKASNEDETKTKARDVLITASSGLRNGRDIISVVFQIFEQELQTQSTYTGSDVPTELLVSCVQFIHSLVDQFPDRVWPLLGQSGLLDYGNGSGTGKLSNIISGVELVSGRYDFLLSCIGLYEALVEDFLAKAVARRIKPNPKTVTRFTPKSASEIPIPTQIVSRSLLSFTRYFIDVLESSSSWKFVDMNDRRRLRRNITRTFNEVLQTAYGLDNSSDDLEPKATKFDTSSTALTKEGDADADAQSEPPLPNLFRAIDASAQLIVDSFLSSSSGLLRFQPLLEVYYDGFSTSESPFYVNESRLCREQVIATLTFTGILLRVGTLLNKPSSHLEGRLFKASPLISRLFASNDAYHIPVLRLFEALIVAASNHTAEPPSLLGHLGARTSRIFLRILSDLDKPLSRDQHCRAIMQFVCKVVSCRQQWSANYILTGHPPHASLNSIKSGRNSSTLDEPLMNSALHPFPDVETLLRNHGLDNLQFMALSHNFWPWATYSSQKYTPFINHISDFAGRLRPLQPTLTARDDPALPSYQTRVAAYIAEILAMHLFHVRQLGQPSASKGILNNLSYFSRFAVAPPSYNLSLHSNLKRNFETKYGCRLLDFQKSSLETPQLGESYFYDLHLADKLLTCDDNWDRRGGFRGEMVAANQNLSLVDAQIALLHGWKLLATELSNDLSDPGLQKMLAKTALDCLESNSMTQGSEEVFNRLCQTRADLALILSQRLIESKSTVPEMQALLGKVWETMRSSDLTFEIALGSGDPSYYRTLLKLLFIGLRVHSEGNSSSAAQQFDPRASIRLTQSSSASPIVLAVLDRVVGNGLRDLATFIHDTPTESSPDDLALITGILQACLRVPGIEFSYSQIVQIFIDNDSPRIATTLFSWSDSLAIAGDPIYGELSTLFLMELSTVPAMAEELAIEGVLGHISAANITSYLRRGNVGPFIDSTGLQRCYSIWVKGILPLVLNLLDSVGAPIASEVSLFLNQFPALLKQSAEAFDAPETSRTATNAKAKFITLSSCSEVHTTSLILFILNGYRIAATGNEIPQVSWDIAAVLENVEFWLNTRAVFRERILPMGDREIAMSKMILKSKKDDDPSNKLEEKAVMELLGIRDVLGGELVI